MKKKEKEEKPKEEEEEEPEVKMVDKRKKLYESWQHRMSPKCPFALRYPTGPC